jgi:hypothetical protein
MVLAKRATARHRVDRRLPTKSRLAWLAVLGQAVACNAVLGFEEGTLHPDSTTTPSGTAGGSAGTENCLDLVDNDGDGRADCDDAECAGDFACAPPAQPDWLGVGWLYIGGREPTCAYGVVTELFDEAELTAGEASCECACSDPSSECSGYVRASIGCGQQVETDGWATATCLTFTVGSSRSCLLQYTQPGLGSCSPIVSSEIPAVAWEPAAWLCLQAGGGHCPDGEACIESADSDGIGPCTARAGDHPCPPAFPNRRQYADGTLEDSRGCDTNDCSCGPPTTGDCTCTSPPCGAELYMTTDCSDDSFGLIPDTTGQCFVTPSWSPPGERDVGIRLVGFSIVPAPSCAVGGTAQPEGHVAAGGTVTVCCADSG